MTALRRLAPLVLLLLCACATFRTAQNTPVGQQEGKRQNQVVEATQPLNGANLMGENGVFDTSTPDPDILTQSANAAISAAGTQKVENYLYQAGTETKVVSITQAAYVAQTQTAQRPAQTATVKAQATENALAVARMTQDAAHETATYTAPMVAATAARLDAQAKNAPLIAVAEPITKIFMSLAFLILSFLAGWLVLKPHPVEPKGAEPKYDQEDFTPIDTTGIITQHVTGTKQYPAVMQYIIPAHVADAKQLEIVANVFARDGFPLSHANFTPSWRGFSEGGWKRFQDFLCNETPYAVWIDATNHQRGFNVVDGFKQYLKQYITDAPRPTLGDEPQTDPVQPTKEQIDTQTDSGEVVGEVADPTYNDNFSAANTGAKILGILQVDKKGEE